MKLYYALGACSLSPHIVAEEAGIPLELVKVDIRKTPHPLEDGSDYARVNPRNYVPALVLDDGEVLTEGPAIVQVLGDMRSGSGMVPPAGTRERVRLQEWLGFINSELHKMYSPWLFHPEHGATAQAAARSIIATRLGWVEQQLERGPFLLGERFTAADAYLFVIVGWSRSAGVDLAAFPRLRSLVDRVVARPAVQRALAAERAPAETKA